MSTECPPNRGLSMLEFVSVLCNPNHHRSNGDLNRLSIPERTRVFQDLAGSAPLQVEIVSELVTALQEMDACLNKIAEKKAFILALKTKPKYVNDPAFRLMFLRGNEYDPQRAANQIVMHFEEKLLLFGPDKIAKDIQLSDLSEDDYESLSSGGIQIANVKDKGGRAIMYFRYEEYRFKKHDNWVGLA